MAGHSASPVQLRTERRPGAETQVVLSCRRVFRGCDLERLRGIEDLRRPKRDIGVTYQGHQARRGQPSRFWLVLLLRRRCGHLPPANCSSPLHDPGENVMHSNDRLSFLVRLQLLPVLLCADIPPARAHQAAEYRPSCLRPDNLRRTATTHPATSFHALARRLARRGVLIA